ncbi:ribosomal protein L10 [Metamycoplasma arthritidis]|uniref:Large ribosomal subunit protein uL10 n=1 Tax=Metamycoplasma arthritidis (strain 158L3-1) TaxID=243272 RepID=B3PM74_META1|nr:50S ribosomal protein L10 [Metamycoplasma arthritidis]ACF07126.1 ribosomal protein L10 [Metamycoplasma arthritidis 158L3-1]VEU78652.1 ribosomal protein L10 [Metamycoplasma arthritidis]
MSALRDAKTLVVKEIADNLSSSKSLIVANYKTLDVVSLQTIREELSKFNVMLKVYKNRLVKHALAELKYDELAKHLVGQNIYAFAKGDDLSAIKALTKFKKQFPALEIVAGIYENKVVDAKSLDEIAKLPSYEESLMILGNSLISPLRNLAIGLKMVIDEGKCLA